MRARWGQLARGSAAAAVLAVAGCSTVLGIESNRYVAAGTPDAGGATHPPVPSTPWGCLSAPSQSLDPNFQVNVQLLVMDGAKTSTAAGVVDGGSDLDTVSGTVLPGVTVKACSALDTNCVDMPPSGVSDDGGLVNFVLPNDFNGFFDLSRPDLIPARLYPGPLLSGDSPVSFPAYDISPDDFQNVVASELSQPAILDPDAGIGHALVTVYDCEDHQASNVSFTYSVADAGIPFYFAGGLPSLTARETDPYGLGGLLNVPAGALTVNAVFGEGNDGGAPMAPIGSVNFIVRPGAITFAWIRVRSH